MQVDFPAPFGPIMAVIRAGARSKSTPSTAVKAPKRFVSPRTSTIGWSVAGACESTAWAALSLMPSLLIAPGTSEPMRSPAAGWAAAPHRAGGGTTRRSG